MNKITEKVLAYQKNMLLLASRPSTVHRVYILEELAKIANTDMVSFPLPNGNTDYFFERNKTLKYCRDICSINSEKDLRKHLAYYQKAVKEYLSIIPKFKKIKVTPQSLIKIYDEYWRVTKIFSPFLLFPILIDDFFNDFSKKLKKYNFAQELIAAASQASIVFDYQKLRLALLKVKTKKDYQKLLPQFDYLTEYSLKERLYTEEDFREILKDIKEKKEEKEVKSYPIIAKRNEKSFQNILRLVKDKEIKAQLSFFHHYVNIRTERAEHLCKVLRYSRYFILALQKLLLQKKYQVTYEQAINLTKEEIYEFLRKGVLSVGMEELNQRVNDKYVVFFDCKKNKTSLIYDTSDISSIINKYKSVSGVEGFKGVIVSKGKVRGKVRIIYRGKDFSFFKQGEILVADSTSPSFMPVMKMSKAIVTNEGGITSHAAIVSRELGIPCVTGTKIATSVLQDGDEVEVDADKGEVIILKKI